MSAARSDAIEAAARVLYAQDWKRPTWDECIGEIEHDNYRAKACLVIVAVLPVLTACGDPAAATSEGEAV